MLEIKDFFTKGSAIYDTSNNICTLTPLDKDTVYLNVNAKYAIKIRKSELSEYARFFTQFAEEGFEN